MMPLKILGVMLIASVMTGDSVAGFVDLHNLSQRYSFMKRKRRVIGNSRT